MITLLETKTKKQRVLVLRPGFDAVLQKFCSIYELGKDNWLFPKENNQKPISRQYVSKLFKKYVHLAMLPDVRLHSLRHAFATHMRDQGVDLWNCSGMKNFKLHCSIRNPTLHGMLVLELRSMMSLIGSFDL
ncbi:tyrosine-type recombinase/integrase [Paenibacillus wynnii]|uniref:tyrosine-type recombinase/integrase n=1 Tax=Paenibacillus wynnii TaxID=268407 RepID=UPI0035945575